MTTTKTKSQCFPHCHMTPEEYGLWDFCRSITAKTGVLFFDGRSIATRFGNTKKNTIYRIRKALVAKGWFELVTESHRKRDGKYSASHYRVLTHPEWASKYPNACPDNENGISTDNGNGPVPKAVMGLSRNANSPVPISGTACPETGTYTYKNQLIKTTDLEATYTSRSDFSPDSGTLPPESELARVEARPDLVCPDSGTGELTIGGTEEDRLRAELYAINSAPGSTSLDAIRRKDAIWVRLRELRINQSAA